MPEGPEVRCVAISLNKYLTEKETYLTSIRCESDPNKTSKYKEGFPKYQQIELLLPAYIKGVTCKGKRLIFMLISNETQEYFYITSHLAMTGRWTFKQEPETFIWFNLQRKDNEIMKEEYLYFGDVRRFGNFEFFKTTEEVYDFLNKNHGPDLLNYAIALYNDNESSIPDNEKITKEVWNNKMRNKHLGNKQICEFLMKQEYFSGIGNYLKAEILYRSHIRPDRILSSLKDDEIELLRINSLSIIYESFIAGGLTIETFWDPEDRRGTFNKLIYDQKVDPLGNKVHKDKFKDGRTTHWVPNLQW